MDHTIIEIEYGSADYAQLRSLWCDVFGDSPGFVDYFYRNFGSDIAGYGIKDENGKLCTELTCHLCGYYEGQPVYVSYAVCTRKDMRGLGLAAELVSFIRDKVADAGGISVLSPAEPSLVPYYEELGYEPHFFEITRGAMSPEFDMEEYYDYDEYDLDIEGADPTPFRADIDMQPLPAEKYKRYREAFLSGQPHIEPSDEMVMLIDAESMDGHGLYSINGGDAICSISSVDPVSVKVRELILNPVLKELSFDIDTEIAAMMARHFGAAETLFSTPGAGRCQGMVYGLNPKPDEQDEEDEYYFEKPYYGFPMA